jgi:UDP-N-acetylglucosamine:LPS N-acetylglucosamine transferase
MARVSRCDVLAISSSGGHWVELSRLVAAFDGLAVEFASTDPGRAADVPAGRFHILTDANKHTPWRLLVCALAVMKLVLGLRPRVVITTGAAPGFVAIAFGKLFGARTVWVETVGAVDRMTLSGRIAKPFADLYLVQWPHLVKPDGPHFRGSLL